MVGEIGQRAGRFIGKRQRVVVDVFEFGGAVAFGLFFSG